HRERLADFAAIGTTLEVVELEPAGRTRTERPHLHAEPDSRRRRRERGHYVEQAPHAEPMLPRLVFVLAAGADEPIGRVGEEDVEGREAAVGAAHVLLQLQAIFVRELRMAVDALLEDAQAVAHRGDLAEERLDRHDLLLRAGLAWFQHHLAAG